MSAIASKEGVYSNGIGRA